LSEPLGPWQAMGGVIVLLGIYLARNASQRQYIIQEKIT
jgi:drug/metabolite transporter (DMT)-like permease